MSGCHNPYDLVGYQADKKECKCPECLNKKIEELFKVQLIHNKALSESNEILIKKVFDLERLAHDFIKSENGRIEKLQNKHEELMEIYKCNFASQKYRESKKPYCCPICNGTGKDKNKLVAEPYDEAIKVLVAPSCHSCKGEGIIWN